MSRIYFRDSKEFINVQNVYCIGKNYLEHIKEFNGKVLKSEIPQEPIIFLKPNTSVVCDSKSISIPEFKGEKISENLQNEVELVVVIGKDGQKVTIENAFEHVLGYAVGIDFTLRDVQSEFKKKGLPWTLSKGFLNSAAVSSIILKENVADPENLKIMLTVNREMKQNANTRDMLFKIPYILYYISSLFGVKEGDLIFTGTPAGVTKLNRGDLIIAKIEGIGELNLQVE